MFATLLQTKILDLLEVVQTLQYLQCLRVGKSGVIFLFRLFDSIETTQLEIEFLDEPLNEPPD